MIEWMIVNWDVVVGILVCLAGLFVGVAKLTPTPKDDTIAAKFKSFVDWLVSNKPKVK